MYKRIDKTYYSEIVEKYKSGWSTEKLGAYYQVHRVTVLNILKRMRCPRRLCTEHLKLNVNSHYFNDIDDEHKAYWLGFIITDGCVHKNLLAIQLAYRDYGHLVKFKNDIGSDHLVGKHLNKNHPSCNIQIKDQILINDLSKYGVVPNKTGKEILPYLSSSELMRHMLRGIIDGDGWITYKSAYRNPQRLDWTVGIVSSNKVFLETIQLFINKSLQSNNGYFYTVKKKGYKEYYTLCFSGNEFLEKLLTWLYKDASIYLERKYNRFLKFQKQRILHRKKNQFG